MQEQIKTPLHEYVEVEARFYRQYEKAEANTSLIEQVKAAQPDLHVVVASRTTCGDCLRNVPRMTRIAESLPGWSWDIFADSDQERMKSLGVVAVPTFILYDKEGGEEIGRIIENPTSGSLEQDLLGIVQS